MGFLRCKPKHQNVKNNKNYQVELIAFGLLKFGFREVELIALGFRFQRCRAQDGRWGLGLFGKHEFHGSLFLHRQTNRLVGI